MTNIWSITLIICNCASLFLIARATLTAVRVILFWDHGSDTNKQIDLESETWLSASLIQTALLIQIFSLILLVIAADHFSEVLAGAMCATGSFLANEYGFPALLCKIGAIFLYGFWIVTHRLDMRSVHSPLTRFKYIFLLLLLPLLLVDLYLQVSYLSGLTPDIITSCCGTLFTPANINGLMLTEEYSVTTMLTTYTVFGVALLILQGYGIHCLKQNKTVTLLYWVIGAGWVCYFPYAILVITMVISSYIYAMPYHHCPFDILRPEYNGVGYPIYFSLFSSSFLGITGAAVHLFKYRPELHEAINKYQKFTLIGGFFLLLVFLLLTLYFPAIYQLTGGE